MEVSREQLMQRFQSLSDEELLSKLAGGTLTALAISVATEELQRRGVAIPAADTPVPAEVQEDLVESDLVTVAQFWDPVQANVLCNCLESHGIFAHVWGEHLAGANIFLSVASGGSRVQVRSDQVAQAKEIIAAFERGDFAIDEEPE